MNFLPGLLPTLQHNSRFPMAQNALDSCLHSACWLKSAWASTVPAPLAYLMDQNSEFFHFFLIYPFETDFHSSSAWPRTLNNPLVSASPGCLFGLRTSSAALSGQWLGSGILGLVQKLYFTGTFLTVLQHPAGLSASPGLSLSRDTESYPSGLSKHTHLPQLLSPTHRTSVS